MEEVGNVEYVMLSDTLCNSGTGVVGTTTFTWKMPYIKPQESPLMYIQPVQVYFDSGTLGVGNVNTSTPMQVRVVSNIADNYYADDKQFPIFTLLVRDALPGHWANPNNNPILEFSTKSTYISFQIETQTDNVPITPTAGSSLNILLKIIRPKQMDMTKNNIASYVRALP